MRRGSGGDHEPTRAVRQVFPQAAVVPAQQLHSAGRGETRYWVRIMKDNKCGWNWPYLQLGFLYGSVCLHLEHTTMREGKSRSDN